MKYAIGAVVATICWMIILYLIPMPEERVRLYDCGMAEWHPDIPKDVKEACRQQRAKQLPRGPIT